MVSNNRMNPMQLIGMLRRSGSPEQFMISLLEQQGGNNPLLLNLVNLARSNNGTGIEQVARNILKERGFDFDKEFEDFKQQFGL